MSSGSIVMKQALPIASTEKDLREILPKNFNFSIKNTSKIIIRQKLIFTIQVTVK